MNVTLRQLRAFVAVAEAAHFTKAAERLHLPQSTVSTLVRDLETNLGLRLFDRHTRKLSLTAAGDDLFDVARKALADLDSIIGDSQRLKTLGRGRVSIAASSLQASLLLPRLVRDYSELYPDVTVRVHDVTENEVLRMVKAGEVDLGLGTAPENQGDLGKQPYLSDTFVAVLPPDHVLAVRDSLTWTDFEGVTIIGGSPGNPIWEYLDAVLVPHGIVLKRRYEVSLPLTMIGMVEGGLGVAILTTAVEKLALALGLVVREITGPVIRRNISLLFHAERSLSPAAQQFRALMFARREIEP